MGETVAFFGAVVNLLTAFTYGGIPIIYYFLACAMMRLILKAVVRTADGGVSNENSDN